MAKARRTPSPKRKKKIGSAQKKTKPNDADVFADVADNGRTNLTTSPTEIIALDLSDDTRELFGLKSTTDTAIVYRAKFVNKLSILDDIATRNEDSDFTPHKEIIDSVESEDILIVEDLSYNFGERYFLCLTEQMVKQYEMHVIEEQEDPFALPNITYQAPTSKPWEHLGSEAEVENERVIATREKISISAFKEKTKLRKACNFSFANRDNNKELCADYLPNHDKKPSIFRKELDIGVQAISTNRERCVGTRYKKPVNKSTQYFAREMDDEQKENVMKSSEMAKFVQHSFTLIERCLKQNSLIDPFRNIWSHLDDSSLTKTNVREARLEEYQSFHDLIYSKDKQIICDEWHPTIPGVVATSCAERINFDTRVKNLSKYNKSPSLILIWNVDNFVHPRIILEAPDDCIVFRFNPSHPALIVGGCLSGRIVLWDITDFESCLESRREEVKQQKPFFLEKFLNNGGQSEEKVIPRVSPSALSSLDTSGISSVSDIKWLSPPFVLDAMGKLKSERETNIEYKCHQFIACSGENHFLVWDVLKTNQRSNDLNDPEVYGVNNKWQHLLKNWHPLTRIFLPPRLNNGKNLLVKFCFSFKTSDVDINEDLKEHEQDPAEQRENNENQFDSRLTIYAGTCSGAVLTINFRVRKDPDTSLLTFLEAHHIHSHTDIIRVISFSPVDKSLLLTAGGYESSVLRVDEHNSSAPLLIHHIEKQTRCRSAAWSVSRASVYFLGCDDGVIEARDILDATDEPLLSQTMSGVQISGVHCLKILAQQALSISDFNGTEHLLLVPDRLTTQQPMELDLIRELSSREEQYQMETVDIQSASHKHTENDQSDENAENSFCGKLSQTDDVLLYEEYLKEESDIIKHLLTFD